MKSLNRRQGLKALGLGLFGVALPVAAQTPLPFPRFGAGFIVLAEQRFNPFVQRLIAEQSLRAFPLYGGQLFYVGPTGYDRREEAMQIRYLETLLRERAAREQETGETPATER